MVHVEGKKIGHILVYALSTCVWCKRTKRAMKNIGVDFYYIDVDLLEGDEKKKIREEMLKWNPKGSYPTIVIDNERCVMSSEESELREALGVD